MIVCERCGVILQKDKIDKILADREKAIKRMNKRSYDGNKKETKKSGDNLDQLYKKVDNLARTIDEIHVNVSGMATAIIDMEKI